MLLTRTLGKKKKSQTSSNLTIVTEFGGIFANVISNNSNAISASVVILESVRKLLLFKS